MNALEEIRNMLYAELECVTKEVSDKGQLNNTALEVVDKLTHSLKSLETIIAMNDYYDDEDEEYSRRSMVRYNNYSYAGNNNRGRNGNNRNGGSSYRGYSYNYNNGNRRYSREDNKEKMLEKLEDYMNTTGSDKVRDAIKKAIEQIESDD